LQAQQQEAAGIATLPKLGQSKQLTPHQRFLRRFARHRLGLLGFSVLTIIVIAALGAPPMAVFVFETLFMLASLVVHANLALPSGIDRLVRLLLVTPDMHRVHHSTRACETDSNYGTVLSGWDRLFGTYCASAQEPLTIGLAEWQDERPARLGWSLLLPFRRS